MLSKTILNVIKLQQKNFVRTPATVSVPIDVYDVDEDHEEFEFATSGMSFGFLSVCFP